MRATPTPCRSRADASGAPPGTILGPEIVAEARSARHAPAREPSPRARGQPKRQPLRRSSAAPALALIVLGAGMAAVAWKETLVRAFPPSAAFFARLGLPVNLRGLGLDGVDATVATEGGDAVLTLAGRIRNLRDAAVAVPTLRFAVRDKDGRELYHWTAPAPKTMLDPGETVPFKARLAAPPEQAQEVGVAFAENR